MPTQSDTSNFIQPADSQFERISQIINKIEKPHQANLVNTTENAGTEVTKKNNEDLKRSYSKIVDCLEKMKNDLENLELKRRQLNVSIQFITIKSLTFTL